MAGLDGKLALVTGASRGYGRAIAQRLARDEVHHEVRRAAVNAIVMHVDDVRSVKDRGCASLALEARDNVRRRGQVRVEEFYGDRRAQLHVTRDPD